MKPQAKSVPNECCPDKILYFDSAATTAPCQAALDKLNFFNAMEYGNPSSAHILGERSAAAIQDARRFFSQIFNVGSEQVIFTGSGTEANNLAINGVAMAYWVKNKKQMKALDAHSLDRPRILCLASEHPAVLTTVKALSDFDFDIQIIPVLSNGVIDEERFKKLLNPQTLLVSIMRVNNIVGALQPVEKLAQWTKKIAPGCLFHSDCIQAFGRVSVPRSPSAVDMVSISGHKVEGPKGIGALIALNPALVSPLSAQRLRPQILGGAQEGGLRSGTQSAALISAFHAAAEQTLKNQENYARHCSELRQAFLKVLERHHMAQEVRLNSESPACVPHILNISIPGFSSGPLAKLLEQSGICLSTGSACSSHKSDPDPTLTAMGLPEEALESALRISFSRHINTEDVQALVKCLDQALNHICKITGLERAPQKN